MAEGLKGAQDELKVGKDASDRHACLKFGGADDMLGENVWEVGEVTQQRIRLLYCCCNRGSKYNRQKGEMRCREAHQVVANSAWVQPLHFLCDILCSHPV